MPTPVGHALAGIVLRGAVAPDEGGRARVALAVAVVAATAPDLDLVLKLVTGQNHHQMETHSLGAAMLAALGVLVLARVRGWAKPGRLALLAGLAWGSHVLLDALSVDTSPPFGVMAFWPLSREHFTFPRSLFLDVWRAFYWKATAHNLLALGWELLLLGPLAWWLGRRGRGTGK